MVSAVLVLLTLLCVSVPPLTALARGTLCRAVFGTCQEKHVSCRGRVSSFLCGSQGLVCCSSERTRWTVPGVNTKRFTRESCPKTPKKCQKRGGQCQARESHCGTAAVDKFCLGNYCTCCLGDHKRCTKEPGCVLRGGFCIKGTKKVCKKGEVVKSGCTGKKCSCCIPAECSCGKANDGRIVGGLAIVPAFKYPWLVGLSVPKISKKYYCGGTIISANSILTAAHCLYNHFTGKVYKRKLLRVGVGDYNQGSTDDDKPGATRLVKVRKIIVHEKYKFLLPHDDIGIIRLASPLDLTEYPQVRAVCLPPDTDVTYEGENGIAYGWGVMNVSALEQPDVVREVALLIWNPTCNGKEIGSVKINNQKLCAGEKKGGKDTCLGDSGGPLTVAKGNKHTLVGITSFGSGCGDPDSPGVYTRVSAYLEWILKGTQGDSYCHN